MEINVYQQCPCHPEKKIKFCCGKDVVSGLTEVIEKSKAGQTAAALDRLERLVAHEGERDCLMTIRTKLLLALGNIEQAMQTNEVFLQRNPGHFLGLQNRTIGALHRGNLAEAVEFLQDAIDSISGPTIPPTFSKTFELVGTALLQFGAIVPAREHFLAALRISSTNERAREFAAATVRLRGSGKLISRRFRLPDLTSTDVAWAKKYENVNRALKRGQFRKARTIFQKIQDAAPDDPVVVRSAAYVSTFHTDTAEINRAFRRFSQLPELQYAERVEAEAIAQLFEPGIGPTYDLVRLTFEVDQLEPIVNALRNNKQFYEQEPDPSDHEEHVPPPRFTFLQLDRDMLEHATGCNHKTLPKVIASIELYGRQTDRAARIEWQGVRDAQFDDYQASLRQAIPSLPEEPTLTEDEGKTTVEDCKQRISWHLPPGLTREAYLDLHRQAVRDFWLNDWPEIPNPHLGLKTPAEVARNPDYEIPMQAAVLHFELNQEPRSWVQSLATEIRQKFGLPDVPKIDLGRTPLNLISPTIARFLDIPSLDDRELQVVFHIALLNGHLSVVSTAGDELIKRPFKEDVVTRIDVFTAMASLTEDDAKCFEYLAEAKKLASQKDISPGPLLVAELEQRLLRDHVSGVARILAELREYTDDPYVEQRLPQVLQQFGLLTEDGQVRLPREPQPAKPESSLWTPSGGSNQSPPPEGGRGEESKLWIPE